MGRNLPSGTVTFLFTDIEGSTRLLHSLGPDAYADALADHRRTLREAFAARFQLPGKRTEVPQRSGLTAAFPSPSRSIVGSDRDGGDSGQL